MLGQGALDLGDFGKPPARDSLLAGVEATLRTLIEGQVLDARHAGMVALLRSEAADYAYAHGIARTNYARLIGDHLRDLLELPVAGEGEDGTTDGEGNNVTRLSAWLAAEEEKAASSTGHVRDPASA